MKNKEIYCKIIGHIVGNFLAHVAFPAALFTIVWNRVLADTFNTAHFNYWTFFIICVGVRYLFSYNIK